MTKTNTQFRPGMIGNLEKTREYFPKKNGDYSGLLPKEEQHCTDNRYTGKNRNH